MSLVKKSVVLVPGDHTANVDDAGVLCRRFFNAMLPPIVLGVLDGMRSMSLIEQSGYATMDTTKIVSKPQRHVLCSNRRELRVNEHA